MRPFVARGRKRNRARYPAENNGFGFVRATLLAVVVGLAWWWVAALMSLWFAQRMGWVSPPHP